MTAKFDLWCSSKDFPKESCDSLEPTKRGERNKEHLIVPADDQSFIKPIKQVSVSFVQHTLNLSLEHHLL